MFLPWSLYALAALSVALLVGLIHCLASSLRRVPGPTSSRVTSLLLRWRELRARRTAYIHQLHQRYGPVVRIAPNEVSFTSWPALKEIYCSGGSGYDKSRFYDLFRVYGRRPMFTLLTKVDHAQRKRLFADRYANTTVMQAASLDGIQQLSRLFVSRCTWESKTKTSDVFVPGDVRCTVNFEADAWVLDGFVNARWSSYWFDATLHAYACDCVTHHLFHPHGSNCLGNKEDEGMMQQSTTDNSLQNRLVSHHSPTLHRLLAGIFGLFMKPRQVPLLDRYVLETSKCSDAASFTLLSRLRGKDERLDSIDVAAECLDHVVAGMDTTGDALCFIMWELSQPRSLSHQQKLTRELRRNHGAPLHQLPFLDAVVCEGLRCFPPIPMSLPRLVPPGGRSIDGFWLPEQTVVSCQAYSVHRINTRVFPDPHVFAPDRWLNSGDADRRRLLFAFANGGRGCVGKHLALTEMKTLLRDVYSKFGTRPDPSMTEESMAMSDQLISTRPAGQRCLLQFTPFDDDAELTAGNMPLTDSIDQAHGTR